jgi:hypothetical protein
MRGRFLAGLAESPSPSNEEVGENVLTEEQTHERYLAFDDMSWAKNEFLEAQWKTAYINDLPDECFAVIKPGGKKDEDGKTVPRSLRYLPYKGADGKIDRPHLRNALARLPQSDLSDEEKKKAEIVLSKAAKEAEVGQYREEDSVLSGEPPLKLPRGWKKKLGWAFGEQESHKNLTEAQIRQRELALGESDLPPPNDDDGSFRDNFVGLRSKFYNSLRGTIREGDQWAILGVNEDRILASVYNEAKSRTDYFQLSYVLEGDTIRITSQRRIPTRGDEFDLGKYLIKIGAELGASKT